MFILKCRDLTSKKDPKFVELKMKVNDFIFFDALFSSVFGDKRTYIITEEDIDVYGDASYEDIPFPEMYSFANFTSSSSKVLIMYRAFSEK